MACYTDLSHSTLVKTALSNIETTNSLFGDGTSVGNAGNAVISNFRHLENLDKVISKQGMSNVLTSSDVAFASAEQTTDLYWADTDSSTDDFVSRIKTLHGDTTHGDTTNPSIYSADGPALAQPVTDPSDSTKTVSCYYPVSNDYDLTYKGLGHMISNVKVNCTGDAGLFGKPTGKLTVSDLQLVDFNITGTASAGALAGTLNVNSSSVTNVLARNSGKSTDATIIASSGAAGGLVGSTSGVGISRSAAALVVRGTTNAGGLIGSAGAGTTISACYSGGHTTNGQYSSTSFNITAAGGNAGGLVGSFSGTSIDHSYSTCSASGTAAGGLVGEDSSGDISSCYSTGLVSGTTMGAFIGTATEGTSLTGQNYYYNIINNYTDDKDHSIKYRDAVGSGSPSGIAPAAFDKDAGSYDSFVGSPTEKPWTFANAYDSKLILYYQGKFNLNTVAQLGAGDMSGSFVAKHYGDWPAPEVFVPNTK